MKKTAALWLASAGAAAAHPGHDAALSGASHWVLSPMHGLGVIALAAVLWTIRARRKE